MSAWAKSRRRIEMILDHEIVEIDLKGNRDALQRIDGTGIN
jgi:hypothetical protein